MRMLFGLSIVVYFSLYLVKILSHFCSDKEMLWMLQEVLKSLLCLGNVVSQGRSDTGLVPLVKMCYFVLCSLGNVTHV